MKPSLPRVLCSIACGLVSPIMAWCAGYDFDERGMNALFTFIGFTFLAGACYTFPGWDFR
jgi:hypothetical protein